MVRQVLWGCALALFVAAPGRAQYQGVPLRVNSVTTPPISESGTPVTTITLGAPPPTATPNPGVIQARFDAAPDMPLPPVPTFPSQPATPMPAPVTLPPVAAASSGQIQKPFVFPPLEQVQAGGQSATSPLMNNSIVQQGPATKPFVFPPLPQTQTVGQPMTPAPFPGPNTNPSPLIGPVVTSTPFPGGAANVTPTQLPMPQQVVASPFTPQPTQPVDRLSALEQNPHTVSTSHAPVAADDGFKFDLFGAVRGDMIYSSARPVAPGTPFFLAPDSPFNLAQDTIAVHARASSLGAILSGPEIGGFKVGGMIFVVFYDNNLVADQYGVLPFHLWGDIKNENWRFAVGLQRDIFNPLDPNTLAFSTLFGSGNTGNYRGQFRIEHFTYPAENAQVTWQLGLSDPLATDITDIYRVSEDNGWPNVEGRVSLALGPILGEGLAARRPFEIGASAVVGQLRTTPPNGRRVTADVWGVGTDFRWRMSERFGFQGEGYTGQTMGTYNGGALQNISAATLDGIRSSGAWGEMYYYLCPSIHTHLGYGIDDPDDDDTDAPPTILRNETYFGNIVWDVTKQFRIGFETTWRRTAYPGPPTNQGMSFHTMVQWSF